MRRWVHLAAGMVLGIVLVATCGGDGRQTIGDAGAADDAGSGGGMLVTAACDQANVLTRSLLGGGTQTDTTYYADVSVPGLDPRQAPRISVALCDEEKFGSDPPGPGPCEGSAPPDPNCSVTGFAPPSAPCRMLSPHQLLVLADRVVFQCGSRHTSTGNDGGTNQTPQDGGSRATMVYVRVN